MNTPATASGNWQYRVKKGAFTSKLARKIYALNELFYRLPFDDTEEETEAETE